MKRDNKIPRTAYRPLRALRGWRLTFLLLLFTPGAVGQSPAPSPPSSLDRPHLVVQLGHLGPVNAVAISPDGRWVVTGSFDGTAKLWDAENAEEIRTLSGHGGSVSSISFSPDGRRVLTGSWDKTAKLWDPKTARILQTFSGHAAYVTSVAFAPDGRRLLTGSEDRTAKLWDTDSGRLLRTFDVSGQVEAVAFSPDGRRVLTGNNDNTATLWNSETGQKIRDFVGHENAVTSVAFSLNGHEILTGSDDKSVRLWDAETGQLIRMFAQPAKVWSVAFSPDGHGALVGVGDQAMLWGTTSGEQIRTFGPHDGVTDAVFSRDGRKVLTSSDDKTAKLWDSATGHELLTFVGDSDKLSSVVFSPEGGRILTAAWFSAARLWDLRNGQASLTFGGEGFEMMESIVFSPDGRRVLTASDDKTARLWDASTGKELHVFNHSGEVLVADFSPDGRRILTGSEDGIVKLWNESGDPVATFRETGEVISAAFSPDGHFIVSSSIDKAAHLWNAETGQLLITLRGHTRLVRSVAFSPDGHRILTGSFDGTARLWDRESGETLRTLRTETPIMSVGYSPDGQLIALGTIGPVVLYDPKSGESVGTLTGHADSVSGLSFSPDARKLVTASFDGTTRLWDVSTHRQLCTLISFTDGTWAVVDAEGRYDASNGGDIKGLHWAIGDTLVALSQLKQRYYDPGLLAKYMGLNREALLNVDKFETPKLFPQVALDPPAPGTHTLHIHLSNLGGGIGKVRVLVNGKELAADARGAKPDPNAPAVTLAVNLAGAAIAPGKTNKIEVVAWNADGYLASRGVTIDWRATGTSTPRLPELYAIVAGISDYADPKLRLNFSGRDAASFAHALQLGADRLFGSDHTHIALLTAMGRPGELAPTRENLREAFAAAQASKPGDVFVIYLAGHGVAINDLYAYPTSEARTLDLSDPAIRAQTAITSDELVDWIKKIPATHQVMILDTCAAGAAAAKLVEKREVPGDQIRAIDQLKDRTGFYVLMGSAADAVSYEASKYGQGLLTYSLLTGLKGAALKNDVDVDVSKLFQFAVDEVPGLALGIGGIQRPQIIAPTAGASFDIGQLEPEDRKQIQLAAEKSIFLRPQLVNAEGPDDLDLAQAVRRELRNQTYVGARGASHPDAIFVDEDDMPGAIRIGGTYVVEQNQIAVQIWLSRDMAKTHIVVHGSSSDIPGLASRITTALLDAGKLL